MEYASPQRVGFQRGHESARGTTKRRNETLFVRMRPVEPVMCPDSPPSSTPYQSLPKSIKRPPARRTEFNAKTSPLTRSVRYLTEAMSTRCTSSAYSLSSSSHPQWESPPCRLRPTARVSPTFYFWRAHLSSRPCTQQVAESVTLQVP